MKNNAKHPKGLIHLYNPKVEGLGSYDFHYMNANKNKRKTKKQQFKKLNQRYVA